MKIAPALLLLSLLTGCANQPPSNTPTEPTHSPLMIGATILALGALAANVDNYSTPIPSGGGGSSGSNLMLYSGSTFLGCLTCSEYDSKSIHNRYSDYGSKYSSSSIYNRYSDYGSRYADTSVCNPYANNPPIIVDDGGGFHGVMTLNKYHRNNPNSAKINAFLAGLCQSS